MHGMFKYCRKDYIYELNGHERYQNVNQETQNIL